MMNQAPVGGLVTARAETTAPSNIEIKSAIEQLGKTFHAFKQENDERLNNIEKDRDDVVKAEKVDRINDSVADLQASVDDLNKKIASASLHSGQQETTENIEYTKTFAKWFRQGKGESEIQAMLESGKVQAALSVGSDPDGGYTVPTEWDRTITKGLVEISNLRNLCSVISISKAAFTKLYNIGGTGAGWVTETATRPNTATSQFSPYTFGCKELYANPATTQTLLDDSEIDIAAWLSAEVSEQFSIQENDAFVNGDGVNQPKGFMTYESGGGHPLGDVAVVNSGEAANIQADTIIDLTYELPGKYSGSASFVCNRKTHSLTRKLKDGQGNYLWQPSYQQGQPAQLVGHAIHEVAEMANVAADALPIAFGDFKRAYLIVDRIGVRVLRDPFTNKPYIQFYTTKRVGGQLNDPEALKYYKISA